MIVSLGLACVAVAWGLLANSQVILFDGAFTLIGTALTGFSLAAARLSKREPSARFPFGLEAVVPLAVGMQGLALLGMIAYAAMEAVRVILDGGSEVAAGAVAAYGAATAAAALGVWAWISRVDPTSDLLDAEARSWWAGFILSVVVLLGSLIAIGLRAFGLTGVEPFVDPVLVLIACLLLIPIPIGMVRTMLVELLEGAPDAEIVEAVSGVIRSVQEEHRLPDPILRVAKVGRKLYVEAAFVVEEAWDVAGEDRVRRSTDVALAELPYDLWLNIELTGDPELAL